MHGGGLELALVFLLAAVIAVPLFKRFGLGAVLGYLAAGVVLGPYGLKVVGDAGPVLAASEIGVVMMLFVIGLELSSARLKLMRGPVFGAGGLQVLLSAIALGALAMLGGLGLKAAVVVGLGLDRREALQLGSVLALGGEFAFVVFAEADKAALLDAAARDRLTAIVGLSMALTPLLVIAAARLVAAHPAKKPRRAFDEIPDGHPQVIIAGIGRFGQIVARLLLAQRIPFVALDANPEQVDLMLRFGNKAYYGDPSRPELLRSAGAAQARIFINAIDNPAASIRATRVVRRLYPQLKVFARAHDRRHAWQLMDLGTEVFRETFASGLEMGREVLVALGVPREVAVDRTQRFREHDERMLASQHLIYDDEPALLESARQARTELEQLFEADVMGPEVMGPEVMGPEVMGPEVMGEPQAGSDRPSIL